MTVCVPELNETQYLTAGGRDMHMDEKDCIRQLQKFSILKIFTCKSDFVEKGQRLKKLSM